MGNVEPGGALLALRPGDPRLPALLALNNRHAEALSPLTAGGLNSMLARAFFAAAPAPPEALLIAFDQSAPYDSPNFLWFRARLPRFVYVDRVVVSDAARGQGLARRLYMALADAACAAGHTQLVCEVNREPPNPASDAFHAALGFVELGEGRPSPGKLVRYLSRPLPI